MKLNEDPVFWPIYMTIMLFVFGIAYGSIIIKTFMEKFKEYKLQKTLKINIQTLISTTSQDTPQKINNWKYNGPLLTGWRTFQPQTFQPQASTLDLSTPDFSTMNFPTPDFSIMNFSIMNFSIMNFSTPDFSTQSPGLESSWLTNLGLNDTGLKLEVEKSGVEMFFNLLTGLQMVFLGTITFIMGTFFHFFWFYLAVFPHTDGNMIIYQTFLFRRFVLGFLFDLVFPVLYLTTRKDLCRFIILMLKKLM